MDLDESYKWGEIFNQDWNQLLIQMTKRAKTLGLKQTEKSETIIWSKDNTELCRWIFVNNPSDIETIRSIYMNDENINSPTCYIVVKQEDPSDDRGDLIFDIFRLNPQSYLWHFNRVFTKPENK